MDRSTAREEAFKLLFQLDINEINTVDKHIWDTFTIALVNGVIEKQAEIEQTIKANLENWSFERIANVEKTILRIATYEINFLEDIPISVSINEAVELGNKYGDEKSGKFINGVLSKIIA